MSYTFQYSQTNNLQEAIDVAANSDVVVVVDYDSSNSTVTYPYYDISDGSYLGEISTPVTGDAGGEDFNHAIDFNSTGDYLAMARDPGSGGYGFLLYSWDGSSFNLEISTAQDSRRWSVDCSNTDPGELITLSGSQVKHITFDPDNPSNWSVTSYTGGDTWSAGCAFSNTHTWWAKGRYDGTVEIFDYEGSDSPVRTLSPFTDTGDNVARLVFSWWDEYLAVGGFGSRGWKMYETESWTEVSNHGDGTWSCYALDYDIYNQKFLGGEGGFDDGQAHEYDVRGTHQNTLSTNESNQITALVFSHDYQHWILCGSDGVFDVYSNQPMSRVPSEGSFTFTVSGDQDATTTSDFRSNQGYTEGLGVFDGTVKRSENLDNFELDNLSAYGYPSDWSLTSGVKGGVGSTNALTHPSTSSTFAEEIWSFDGLAYYPGRGDQFSFYFTYDSDTSTDRLMRFRYGAADQNNYLVIGIDNQELKYGYWDSGSGTMYNNTNHVPTAGSVMQYEIRWESADYMEVSTYVDGQHEVTLEHPASSGKDNVLSNYSQGGISWYIHDEWDNPRWDLALHDGDA